MKYNMLRFLISLIIILIAACSTLPDHRIDYKQSDSTPPLEIPPSLSSQTIQDQLAIPDREKTPPLLPLFDQVQLKRAGLIRWLEIRATPTVIWPKIKEFLTKMGFSLEREEPQIGVIETAWAENRANIPQDGFRKWAGKFLGKLYSSNTRDKFKIRLERSANQEITELYLTHQGVQEVVTQGEQFIWQARPADPELEAEMLNRLLVFLGLDEKQANQMLAIRDDQRPQAELLQTPAGQLSLQVRDDLLDTWRRTELALDHAGFTIKHRDDSKKTYLIRYATPEDSLLARWFSQPQDYLLSLTGSEEHLTQITVLDAQGQPSDPETVKEILVLLQEELK